MSKPAGRTGSCQCGNITYTLLADPLALYACHCLECQKQSSSAFGMSMWMHRQQVEFNSGELRLWTTSGDSGLQKTCAFCGNCGTRIYHATDDGMDILSMKAGCLDDTSWLEPTCHLWSKRMQPWLKILMENEICYADEPPGDAELLEQWRHTDKHFLDGT